MKFLVVVTPPSIYHLTIAPLPTLAPRALSDRVPALAHPVRWDRGAAGQVPAVSTALHDLLSGPTDGWTTYNKPCTKPPCRIFSLYFFFLLTTRPLSGNPARCHPQIGRPFSDWRLEWGSLTKISQRLYTAACPWSAGCHTDTTQWCMCVSVCVCVGVYHMSHWIYFHLCYSPSYTITVIFAILIFPLLYSNSYSTPYIHQLLFLPSLCLLLPPTNSLTPPRHNQ